MNLSSFIIYETICEVDRGKMAVHNFFRVTFSFFILASFSFHNIYHKLHNCLFYFHLPLTHVSDMSRYLFSSLPTPYPSSSSISYHGKWMYIYCLYLLYFSLLQFLLHTESSFFFLFFHLGSSSSSLAFPSLTSSPSLFPSPLIYYIFDKCISFGLVLFIIFDFSTFAGGVFFFIYSF